MAQSPAANLQAARRDYALSQLRAYRRLREDRDEHIRTAAVAGARQSEIARASGMSRQGVAMVLTRDDSDEVVRVSVDCTCVYSCADDPATACSLSGEFHTHPDDGSGVFGPCPVHPQAPVTP